MSRSRVTVTSVLRRLEVGVGADVVVLLGFDDLAVVPGGIVDHPPDPDGVDVPELPLPAPIDQLLLVVESSVRLVVELNGSGVALADGVRPATFDDDKLSAVLGSTPGHRLRSEGVDGVEGDPVVDDGRVELGSESFAAGFKKVSCRRRR